MTVLFTLRTELNNNATMSGLWLLVYMAGLLVVLSSVVVGATPANPSDLEAPPRYYHPQFTDILCLKCAPGTYLLEHCTRNLTNSICKECEAGKFSTEYNQAKNCASCRTLEQGCPIRNAHLVIVCNSTTNNYCVCNNSFYFHPKSQNSQEKYEGDCEPHSQCPAGQGVRLRGTPKNDTKCEPCPPGTFSDEESATAACSPYMNCSAGTVPVGGTSKKDVSCKPPDSEVDNTGMIVSIIVPVLVIIIIIIIGVFFGVKWWRRRRRRPDKDKDKEKPDGTLLETPENGSKNKDYKPVSCEETPPAVTVFPPSDPPATLPSNGVNENTLEVKSRPKIPWDVINPFLATKLSGESEWKMALRSIMSQSGYPDGDQLINEHTTNNPRDVKEVIYQVLYDWSKKSRCKLDMVIKGLEEQNLNKMAQDLKQHPSVKPFLEKENTATS